MAKEFNKKFMHPTRRKLVDMVLTGGEYEKEAFISFAGTDKEKAKREKASVAQKETAKIDEEAKNGQKRRSLNDATAKQDYQNKMAWEIRGATAMEQINLDAYKQIEEAKMEMANKNRDEGNHFAIENKKALEEKILSIAIATTDKIKAYEDKIFIAKLEDEQAFAQMLREDQDKADDAYNNILKSMNEINKTEQTSLRIEDEKLKLKYDTLGMSEKEIALRQAGLEYEEKELQLRLRSDLKSEDKDYFRQRNQELLAEKRALIEFQDQYKTLDEMAKSVYSNMGEYIDQFVKTGKFSFQDFVRSTIQGLIAIQMKAQLLSLTGGSSGVGDILKKVFGMGGGLKGNTPEAPVSLETFASGGSIDANQLSIIGEQGPELFMPSGAGTIIPNNLLGGGGGQTINYNGPYIASMSAIDTQTGVQFLAKNKQTIWASYQSANRSVPVSR
jgi:hypothetical protein